MWWRTTEEGTHSKGVALWRGSHQRHLRVLPAPTERTQTQLIVSVFAPRRCRDLPDDCSGNAG
eukprot:1016878-Amphidinium_carterae.1